LTHPRSQEKHTPFKEIDPKQKKKKPKQSKGLKGKNWGEDQSTQNAKKKHQPSLNLVST